MKGYILQEHMCGITHEEDPVTLAGRNRLFSMDAKMFCDAVTKVLFASELDTNSQRYFLQTICIEAFEDNLRLVATDGRRLATVSFPIQGIDAPTYWLIDNQEAKQMLKLTKDWKTMVVFDVSKESPVKLGAVDFPSYDRLMEMKQVSSLAFADGFAKKSEYILPTHETYDFPLWRRILPPFCPHAVCVDRQVMLNVLGSMFYKVLQSHVPDPFRHILLEIADHQMSISPEAVCVRKADQAPIAEQERLPALKALTIGDAVTIDAELPYSHFRLGIALNAPYLIDALKSLDSELVQLNLTDSHHGVLLTPPRSEMAGQLIEESDQLHLVMPVRSTDADNFSVHEDEYLYNAEALEDEVAAD